MRTSGSVEVPDRYCASVPRTVPRTVPALEPALIPRACRGSEQTRPDGTPFLVSVKPENGASVARPSRE